MIIVMKQSATVKDIENVENRLLDLGFKTHPIHGDIKTVIGAIGDKRLLNVHAISQMQGVETLVPIMKPYKLASNELQHTPTVIDIGGVKIGGEEIVVMAGPCAIENEKDFVDTAISVKNSGAKILRGGAFKPRSSPYAFQGLEEDGLKIMVAGREATGLKMVTEVVDTRDVELVNKYTDIFQIGARNMQNFRLLSEVGMTRKPVLLKRGLSATIEEWLMAAEYIIAEGNHEVILCERGIRTFETITRNTLDLSAIPAIKDVSHLPVVVDPSHATGNWKYVPALAKGAIATGADGLIIEVHPNPPCALCDGPQSLRPERFKSLMDELRLVAQAVQRTI
ncbi:phospho-2-dehydro-3-deoxyheptonate aldolase [Ruminiclostridium papyrosolvens DSM 2782]|uniref:Phospho-2-dehydro-3-deoxyheptonate aldolase n=1 Tax=Ruminiclostridium papyrosolvens DSM 2782 TaxID=588581 RepID=F1THS0_9FIRM|nr:3-deoxy-7-phosphoheptulonate synthase [Ruminiclostridium papyrosolvens]EGD46052.1 phospho-2-dehydro-3-deoxyheptonate aldolase [Ruminiclostridium papyrosolvens DSM 2782]WES32852.1 3-deoxy-7-phosphoheptulonate synthase [Ruminiclostridium papyrosolvens DSM 2782]